MERQTMGQERLSAFIDAVIAIIMTILVLELDKPKTLDWQGLWELRENFFCICIVLLLVRRYVGESACVFS